MKDWLCTVLGVCLHHHAHPDPSLARTLRRIERKIDHMTDAADAANAILDRAEVSLTGVESDVAALKDLVAAALARTDMTADEEAQVMARVNALADRIAGDDASYPAPAPEPTPAPDA